MPCPEKFKKSLYEFEIEEDTVKKIDEGFDGLVSSSDKRLRAEYFKRATDILCAECNIDTVHCLYEANACCKGGKREKASKEFALKYRVLSLSEKLEHVNEVPYMGSAELDSDGNLVVHALSYMINGRYSCACTNFNNSGIKETVRKDYCYCCAGHFRHHYEIMLGVKLKTLGIVSSPLDSEGKYPCVIKFEIRTV